MIIANIENIVLSRAKKGLTQRQFALKAGMSPAAMCNLESGKPISPITVKKVMDAMESQEVERYFCYVSGR